VGRVLAFLRRSLPRRPAVRKAARPARPLSVCLVILAFAGCGGATKTIMTPAPVPPGASIGANEHAIRSTFATWLAALNRRDGPAACAQLSAAGRRAFEAQQGKRCETAIPRIVARHERLVGIAVVPGDAAAHVASTANATQVGDNSGPVRFEKVGSIWKIARIEFGQ